MGEWEVRGRCEWEVGGERWEVKGGCEWEVRGGR